MSFVLHPFVDGKRRNAYPRQAEMIGAVEVSCLRPRIRTNRQPELLCGRLHRRIKRRPLRARNFHFLWRAQRLHIVIIQIQRNLSRRNRRMLSQILRSQQSLLFRRDRSKQNRAPRLLRRRPKGARQLQQDAAARRIVDQRH